MVHAHRDYLSVSIDLDRSHSGPDQKSWIIKKYNLYPIGNNGFAMLEKPDNISFVFEEQQGKMLLTIYENGRQASP